ncbi:hypothetical protein ACFP81_06405 [Deinococcus lacus]|uniref:Uncharacterized protein n=1 Tax=Deinococcus lacus TaxID=392561 RepID=A0ABW1YEJ5_9DEIO
MKQYKVKQDFSDAVTGAMVRAGDTITATDARAEELRAGGVINVTPVAVGPEPEAATEPASTTKKK